MMNEIVIAIIGLVGTIFVAGMGLYGAKKYNIGPNQDKLVATLKAIVDAQDERITQLEESAVERDLKVVNLTEEVTRLTKLTISQLVKIQELELQLENERRGHV